MQQCRILLTAMHSLHQLVAKARVQTRVIDTREQVMHRLSIQSKQQRTKKSGESITQVSGVRELHQGKVVVSSHPRRHRVIEMRQK